MKHLPKEQTDLLMQIISTHYPSQQILHISDLENDLHEALYDFTKEKDFEYDLKTIESRLPEESLKDTHTGFTVEALDLSAKGYNKHAKKYENIFVTLEPERLTRYLDTFFKKSYRIMKNAAVIAVIVPKGSPAKEKIEAQLEKDYFVALNTIDIFDDYDVITAKKMHGWGAYSVGF
jgi:hypothetical protein